MLTAEERDAALRPVHEARQEIEAIQAQLRAARGKRNTAMLEAEQKGVGAGTVARAGGMSYSNYVLVRDRTKQEVGMP